MAAKLLPPLPVGVAPGSGYWNDWYEKLRNLINSFATGFPFSSITLTPITLAGYGIGDGATKNGSNRMNLGVDTTDDVIVDTTTKGVVLKSANGHYWRSTISNAGVLTWTDLGTIKP
jgi:hypothetical protein